MKRLALPLLLAGAGVLAGCAANTGTHVRPEPTYEEAKSSLFVAHNRDAITALLSGLDMKKIAETPLLVASKSSSRPVRANTRLLRPSKTSSAPTPLSKPAVLQVLAIRSLLRC